MASSAQFAHLKFRTSSSVLGLCLGWSGSGVFAHAGWLHVTSPVLQPGLVQAGLEQSMQRTLSLFLLWIALFEKQSRGLTSSHSTHCKPRQFRQRHSSNSPLLLGYLTSGPDFQNFNMQPPVFWQSTSRQTLQVVHSGTVHSGLVQAWHTNGRLSGSCRQFFTRRSSKRCVLFSPQA